MVGVIANSAAIILGVLVGVFFKKITNEKISEQANLAMGICTILIGTKMSFQCESIVLMMVSVLVGGLVGHIVGFSELIEKSIKSVLRLLFRGNGSKSEHGVLITSILFCTGAMAVIGSIRSGATGDHEILYTKAIIDGVISVFFGTTYGVAIVLSAFSVFVYQGALTLLSSQLEVLSSVPVTQIISGVGGVLLVMIGLDVAKIKKVAVAEFLPALPIGVILALIFSA